MGKSMRFASTALLALVAAVACGDPPAPAPAPTGAAPALDGAPRPARDPTPDGAPKPDRDPDADAAPPRAATPRAAPIACRLAGAPRRLSAPGDAAPSRLRSLVAGGGGGRAAVAWPTR